MKTEPNVLTPGNDYLIKVLADARDTATPDAAAHYADALAQVTAGAKGWVERARQALYAAEDTDPGTAERALRALG